MLQHRHTLTVCRPSEGREVNDVFGHPGAGVGLVGWLFLGLTSI